MSCVSHIHRNRTMTCTRIEIVLASYILNQQKNKTITIHHCTKENKVAYTSHTFPYNMCVLW